LERLEFKSGLGEGGGLTTDIERVLKDGVYYCDTPGFDDFTRREAIRERLTANFQRADQTYSYKFMAVITLNEGRLMAGDFVVMKLILDCLPVEGLEWGLVVNKVNAANNRDRLTQLIRGFFENANPRWSCAIPHLCFVERIPEAEGQDNVLVDVPELREFLDSLPFYHFPSDEVKEIAIDQFDEERQAMNDQLREEEARHLRELQEVKRQHEAEREKARQDENTIVKALLTFRSTDQELDHDSRVHIQFYNGGNGEENWFDGQFLDSFGGGLKDGRSADRTHNFSSPFLLTNYRPRLKVDMKAKGSNKWRFELTVSLVSKTNRVTSFQFGERELNSRGESVEKTYYNLF